MKENTGLMGAARHDNRNENTQRAQLSGRSKFQNLIAFIIVRMMSRYTTVGLLILSKTVAFVSRPVPSHQSSSSTRLLDIPASAIGLYEIQEEILVKRGILEEELMSNNQSQLKAIKVKGAGSSGGFGGATGSNKAGLKSEAKAHAKVLQKEGVVRIDGALSANVADAMRDFVVNLRENSEEEVSSGTARSIDRFANVLLRKNRCDLKIPLGSKAVTDALHDVFCKSALRQTIEELLSSEAVLYELSCLISDPGSQRQVVHPDNPCSTSGANLKDTEPILLTCFIALQDIDLTMGPTVWIPKTHNIETHNKFRNEAKGIDDSESPKDNLLRTKSTVLGILPKGSCALYDSRVLHCGSANRSGISRALFYFSFKNPKVGYPGNPASICAKLGSANLAIKVLGDELDSAKSGRGSPLLDSLSGH